MMFQVVKRAILQQLWLPMSCTASLPAVPESAHKMTLIGSTLWICSARICSLSWPNLCWCSISFRKALHHEEILNLVHMLQFFSKLQVFAAERQSTRFFLHCFIANVYSIYLHFPISRLSPSCIGTCHNCTAGWQLTWTVSNTSSCHFQMPV